MESMVDFKSLFGGVYEGKRVLVTGHTGFKGSWLAYWLDCMGAKVYGYSLSPNTEIAHIDLLDVTIESCIGDIRDFEKLSAFVNKVKPDVVFHLAAQALVRDSYDDPIGTYGTNVMGTLHLFEACRSAKSVQAIVNVTTDKCYENKEWIWGYRENDPMGGYDPYSSSKGCVELLTASYRNSFIRANTNKENQQMLIASARAGNVVGGGDWAKDRLLPDIVKAASNNESVLIRNPHATRPWQHVLEPLSGYLTLAWRLLLGQTDFADGWNFGPDTHSNVSVERIVDMATSYWPNIRIRFEEAAGPHEANLLMLDCSKANKLLKWEAVWGIEETIHRTINWYRKYYEDTAVHTKTDLSEYIRSAQVKEMVWAR